jgi:hypothetical protein
MFIQLFMFLKDYFNTTDPLHVCNLIVGMLFVVIGFSTYRPNTRNRIKYKNKNKNKNNDTTSNVEFYNLYFLYWIW